MYFEFLKDNVTVQNKQFTKGKMFTLSLKQEESYSTFWNLEWINVFANI